MVDRTGARFDLSLYLVTDRRLCGARGVVETVRQAVAGGATLVQLRDPQAPIRALVEEARAIKALLGPLGIPLIINDRVDVALAAGADGVHLGQDDMDAETARAILGPGFIIGLSIGSAEEHEASRAALPSVDYIGVGPLYGTATKADAGAAIGPEGLRAVIAAVGKPAVAIGGIGPGGVAPAIAAGAHGVAVVSALCAAPDPAAAAAALRREVAAARG